MARQLIKLAATAVGTAYGGPLGGMAAGAAAGYIMGPEPQARPEPQHSEGPRLGDLSVTSSNYGTIIPLLYGHPRVSGTIVWASDKKEHVTVVETGGGGGGGGKGGGGGAPPEPVQVTTTYSYTADVLYLVAANPTIEVGRIWVNNAVVYPGANPPWEEMQFHGGRAYQDPFPVYEAAVGTANAVAYRGRTTIMLVDLDLPNGQMPNVAFEIFAYGAVLP